MTATNEEILDVAIVGGGVSGAYSAWRLLCDDASTADRRPKLALFEGSDRIGGRLLSLKPPGMEKLVCELGGMFYASVQPRVCAVVKKLGLPVETLPHTQRDLMYLRRERFTTNLAGVPYNFTPEEKKASSPDMLFPNALEKLIPGVLSATGPALDKLLRETIVDGHHVADWGFWNMLYLAMSSEAFAYSHDSTPDDYMLINWNAADAIRGMQIFGAPNFEVYHLTDGYDRLPKALAEAVDRAAGEPVVRTGHRLQSFELAPGGLVRMNMVRNSVGWGPAGKGEPYTILARKLILAMPKRSLELLQQTGPLFESSRAQAMIGSVTTIPMFKMFSCYAEPWWKKLGYGPQGFAITDMPLRACLYWGMEGDQPGADPKNTNSLLLTTLDDMSAASFWAGLRDPHHFPRFAPSGDLAAVLHGSPGSKDWQRYADCTTDRVVKEAQRQLIETHGVDIPEPYAAASMNWTVDPFGGAVNFWKIHVRSEEMATAMTQPVRGLPVYVCGEAYSRSQGWVEGALETAELMLHDHFGLAAPSWLAST